MLAVMIDPPELAEALAHHVRGAEDAFDGQMTSLHPGVQALLGQVAHYRGKMLRPHLVVLAAMAACGDMTLGKYAPGVQKLADRLLPQLPRSLRQSGSLRAIHLATSRCHQKWSPRPCLASCG